MTELLKSRWIFILSILGSILGGSLYLLFNTGEWTNDIHGLFYGLFILSVGYTILLATKKLEFFNIERLLKYLLPYSIAAILINAVPVVLKTMEVQITEINLLQSFIVVVNICYLYFTLFMFRRLIFVRKTYLIIVTWRFFLSILLLVSVLTTLEIRGIVLHIILGMGLATGLVLVARQHWIGMINRDTKLFSLGLFFLLSLIAIFISYQLQHYDHCAHNYPYLGFSAPTAMIAFTAAGYGLFSLLTLFFNLPFSRDIETNRAELQSFIEAGKSIQNQIGEEEILQFLFYTGMENTRADAGFLEFEGIDNNGSKVVDLMGLEFDNIIRIQDAFTEYRKLESSLDGYYTVTDIKSDPFWKFRESQFRTVLIFPLTVHDKIKGWFYLLKKQRVGFDQYMIEMMGTFVSQTILSLNNNYFLREALKTERLQQSIEIGKDVQRKMLPTSFPVTKGVKIAAQTIPAEDVGGDFYDYFLFKDGKVGVVIGDISGKGTLAAYHVATTKGIFQAVGLDKQTPKEFIAKVNMAVGKCFEKEMFLTALYLLIDPVQQKLTYVRAGHCPLLYYNAASKEAVFIEDEGLGLGILRSEGYNSTINENHLNLDSGDIIVIFSDGLVEGRNSSGVEFGYNRILESFNKSDHTSEQSILDSINKEFETFTTGGTFVDDNTILIIRIE